MAALYSLAYMSVYNLRERELGIVGLAILRNYLTENVDLTKKLVKTVKKIVALYDHKYSKKEILKYDTLSGYMAWSETYDDYPNLLIDIEEPVVRKLIPKQARGKAIDIACGTGRYSKILKDIGYDVVGVDQSAAMLSRAREKVLGVEFVKGKLTNLPFDKESFDFAICALALTHVKSLRSAIFEISRIVKVRGKIVISDLHPWFVTLGGPAKFYDKKGNEGYIREYVHWHSEYLNIFNELNLQLIEVREPQMRGEHLTNFEKNSFLDVEINRAALSSLPLALVWVLEKKPCKNEKI